MSNVRLLIPILALGTAVSASAAPAAAPQPERPKLGVLIVVDGLSMPRLMERRPWLKHGLARLLDEGFVYEQAHYRHINTETAPGHASLSTGAPPSVTGIASNFWYELRGGALQRNWAIEQLQTDRVPGQPPLFLREVAKDDRLYVFASKRELDLWQRSGEIGKAITRMGYGPNGETVVFDGEDAITLYNWRHGKPAESFEPTTRMPGPGNLKVPTLADRLVAANPEARVVSLSGKDRSAMLMAGRDPRHAAYWFDKSNGRFTSSGAYDTFGYVGGLAGSVVSQFNRERMGARLPGRFGLEWHPLPDPDAPFAGFDDPRRPRTLATELPKGFVANDALADFQIPRRGLRFPHKLAEYGQLTPVPDNYWEALYDTPMLDELVADLAIALVEDERLGLGRRAGASDLLLVSLSSHDLVSHNYGAESEESLDALRRVDVQIERVLQALEKTIGRDRLALAFSADHGFAPIPESHRRYDLDTPGGRLITSERVYPSFPRRLSRMLAEALCVPYDPLPSGQLVLFTDITWSVFYNRAALPLRTVEGPCGPAGRVVDTPDLDRALPEVIARGFAEELEAVYLASQRASWPEDDPRTAFARNAFDPERGGDAILFPRPGVLMHWDVRGSGHGTHHAYDTHVPVVFWGGAFRKGSSGDATAAPYDIAPTLGSLLGVSVPDATGRDRAAEAGPIATRRK